MVQPNSNLSVALGNQIINHVGGDQTIYNYNIFLGQVRETDRRLSTIENIPLQTSLGELRNVALQLANIARFILAQQEHHPINRTLEELSTTLQLQIDRAVDLNDRISLHESTNVSNSDAASAKTARLSDYLWESSRTSHSDADEGLALSLQRLMQGPLASPQTSFPSSIYTPSIRSLDIRSEEPSHLGNDGATASQQSFPPENGTVSGADAAILADPYGGSWRRPDYAMHDIPEDEDDIVDSYQFDVIKERDADLTRDGQKSGKGKSSPIFGLWRAFRRINDTEKQDNDPSQRDSDPIRTLVEPTRNVQKSESFGEAEPFSPVLYFGGLGTRSISGTRIVADGFRKASIKPEFAQNKTLELGEDYVPSQMNSSNLLDQELVEKRPRGSQKVGRHSLSYQIAAAKARQFSDPGAAIVADES